MLSHVASSLPYIFYDDTNMLVSYKLDPLGRCYRENNLLGFIYVYKQIPDGIVATWSNYTDYLIEAVKLYHPSSELADNILDSYCCNSWTPQREELIKLLLQYTDYYDKQSLGRNGYYHLLPGSYPDIPLMRALSIALENNNVEEVKYLLSLTQDLTELALYDSLITHIDNRESLALIMPYLHTCNEQVNRIIAYAYVNNKLPDIPTEHADKAPIKILQCHFHNTELTYAKIDINIFHLAGKFCFSESLIFDCITLSNGIDKYITKFTHYVQSIILKYASIKD